MRALFLPQSQLVPAPPVPQRPPPEPSGNAFERELESRINQGNDRDDRRKRLSEAYGSDRPDKPPDSRRSSEPPEARSTQDRPEPEPDAVSGEAPTSEPRSETPVDSQNQPETPIESQGRTDTGGEAAPESETSVGQGDSSEKTVAPAVVAVAEILPRGASATNADVSQTDQLADRAGDGPARLAGTQATRPLPVAPALDPKTAPTTENATGSQQLAVTGKTTVPITGTPDQSTDTGQGQGQGQGQSGTGESLIAQGGRDQGPRTPAASDRAAVSAAPSDQPPPSRTEMLAGVASRLEASTIATESEVKSADGSQLHGEQARPHDESSPIQDLAARIASVLAPGSEGSAVSSSSHASGPDAASSGTGDVNAANPDVTASRVVLGPAVNTQSQVAVSKDASNAASSVDGLASARLDEITGQAKVEDIARVVGINMGTRNARVSMQLNPPQLGAMQIDVRLQQDVMNLRIIVESEAAFTRIGSTAALLKHALEQQGVAVEHIDIQLKGSESGAPRAAHGQGHGQDSRFSDGQQAFDHQAWSGADSARDHSRRTTGELDGEPGSGTVDTTVRTETTTTDSLLTATAVDLVA